MDSDRFYMTEVSGGAAVGPFFFYATVAGARIGMSTPKLSTSSVSDEYNASIQEIQAAASSGKANSRDAASLEFGDPVELGREELIERSPTLHPQVIKAIDIAKEEIGRALHPITITWYWGELGKLITVGAVFNGAGSIPNNFAFNSARQEIQRMIRLRISDDTPWVCRADFTHLELSDRMRVERRISRLYSDLLEYRSHKQLELIIAGSSGDVGES